MAIQTFPTSLYKGLPFKRSPTWNTLKHRAVSGRVTALQQWSAPIYKYEAVFEILRSNALAEWQTLMAFYNSVGGAAQVFKFIDDDDYVATDQEFGPATGLTDDYQLVRTLGGFVEPVYAPTITEITIDDVATADYTESGGLITFGSTPANGASLKWTGTFAWLCRFDEDSNEFDKFAYQFWNLGRLAFTTEKL